MRREDLEHVMGWVEDRELALALLGANTGLTEKVYSVLPLSRIRKVRDFMESPDLKGTAAAPTPEDARKLIVNVIKRL